MCEREDSLASTSDEDEHQDEALNWILQALLSTSLLHALQEYEKIVMVIFLLFHIIIEILYAAACVAVSNLIPALMQRAFVYGFEGVAA